MSKNIRTGGIDANKYIFGLGGDRTKQSVNFKKTYDDEEIENIKKKFAIMPYNASTSNLLLNLRGLSKEGYGGMAMADVLFVSDERCIVIQTIYNKEVVYIQDGKGVNKTLKHQKWNAYNEVFYIYQKVPRDYSKSKIIDAEFYESAEKAKHTQGGIKYKYKSRDADRFMSQQFGSRELLSKKGARAVSSGVKTIVGISTCFPVDSILKKNG